MKQFLFTKKTICRHNGTVKKTKRIIIINNDETKPKDVKKIFKSIRDKKILKLKGGYLFKSTINESQFHLGILPVMIEGERTHHYDIKLDYENEYIFSGFFNLDGTLGILFTPPGKKEDISDNFKSKLKETYIATAETLISHGFPEETKLDWISQKALEEIGIYDPIPSDLKSLIS